MTPSVCGNRRCASKPQAKRAFNYAVASERLAPRLARYPDLVPLHSDFDGLNGIGAAPEGILAQRQFDAVGDPDFHLINLARSSVSTIW